MESREERAEGRKGRSGRSSFGLEVAKLSCDIPRVRKERGRDRLMVGGVNGKRRVYSEV